MGIECGECERDLRGGHDKSCSRYRPCVCPACLVALEDGDGYLWCREHGEVSPLENRRAIETIARLTKERDEARATTAKLPRLTDAMILAAAEGHYGKRRTARNGGPDGISMTVEDTDHSFSTAMKRMWSGINQHLARLDQTKDGA